MVSGISISCSAKAYIYEEKYEIFNSAVKGKEGIIRSIIMIDRIKFCLTSLRVQVRKALFKALAP